MKQPIYFIILIVLIILAWDTPILYPLKLLVVFFHESSHALASLLTGGTVNELVINAGEGGYVISQGGNRFIILSAGYIGSLFWGVIIYIASVKSHYDKSIMALLGVCIIVIALKFSTDVFSILFGLLTGAAMLLIANNFAEHYNDFILKLIGLISMMYAPLDIYSDTISRSYLQSDAYLLAEYTGGTTLLWGSIWIIISMVVIFYCFKWVLK
jgi:hypothetical protein